MYVSNVLIYSVTPPCYQFLIIRGNLGLTCGIYFPLTMIPGPVSCQLGF